MKTNQTLVTLSLLLMLSPIYAKAESGIDYFLFSAQGSCADIEKLRFQHASSFAIPLGTNVRQEELQAEIEMHLFPDGTFWAKYSETALTNVKYLDGWKMSDSQIEFEKVVEGRWSMNGRKVIIPGLGVGVLPEIQYDTERPAFMFTVTEPLNDPRMHNRTVRIKRAFINRGPRGIFLDKYCGRSN